MEINSIKDSNRFIRTCEMSIIFPLYGSLFSIAMWSEYGSQYPFILNILKIFEYILPFFLLVLFLDSKPTFKLIILYLFLCAISIYSLLVIHDYRFFMFILFLFAGRNIGFKRVIKADLIGKSITFLFIILSFLLGILPDVTLQRTNSLIRHSLGFAHPNFLAMSFMLIILEYFLIRNNEIYVIEIFAILLLSLLINVLSNGRGAEFVELLMCLLSFITHIIGQKKIIRFIRRRSITILLTMIPSVLSIISYWVLLGAISGTQLALFISSFLSGRLAILQFYYSQVGIHLFPKSIQQVYINSTFVGMDNTYIYLLVSFGLISLVIYCIVVGILIHNSIINNNLTLLLIIISLCLLGLVDSTNIYPFVGFFVLSYDNYVIKEEKYA